MTAMYALPFGHTVGIEPVSEAIRARLKPDQPAGARAVVARHDGYVTKVWATDLDLPAGWTLPALAAQIAQAEHATLISERQPLPSAATVSQILSAAADLIETGRVVGEVGVQLGLHAIRVALFDATDLRAWQVMDRRYVAARHSMHRELMPREASPRVVAAILRAAAEAQR